ncbi:hypothetical protein K2X05_09065 [bacterium]|nr:hypothetical protein [bacterium]
MFNTYSDALMSLLELKKNVGTATNWRKEKSKLVYNPIGFWGGDELLEALLQKKNEFTSQFWYWIFNLEKSPKWFQQIIKNRIQRLELNNLSSVDSEHMACYGKDLLDGRSIVVVAHSQGNFFTNSSANMLDIQFFPIKSHFKMISVATPASSVTNHGPHFTLLSDGVIKWIPNSLPANSSNTKPTPGIFDHAFIEHYLSGQPTGSNIVNAVHEAFKKLASTTKNPENDEDENCDD